MRRVTRNSRFGLTVNEVMEQLEPLLQRIRVPAPDTNREDMLAAYALIRELPQGSLESTRAVRRLDEAMSSSRRQWRELNRPPEPPPRRDPVAEMRERQMTGRGNTVYDTATIYGPLVGNPITFNRMTSGRPPAFEMLQYQRNPRPTSRDWIPTGDYREMDSTGSTGLEEVPEVYDAEFGKKRFSRIRKNSFF
jgi:hypothetical protein